MEKDIYKDVSNQCLHKKHLDDDDDDTSSVHTDVPSDPWFDEGDLISSKPNLNFQETKTHDISYSILYSKDPDETKLIEEEIDLYQDLVMKEDTEKQYKEKLETELENLKKEVQTLREADAKNSSEIEKLTAENTNLKKSICSLYQTVKSEIEHKDYLLAEENRKKNLLLHHIHEYEEYFGPITDYRNKNYNGEKSDNKSYKRKRSQSPKPINNEREPKPSKFKTNNEKEPEPSKSKANNEKEPGPSKSKTNNEKEPESSRSKTNNEKDLQADKHVNNPQNDSSKPKEKHSNELQKTDNQNALYQTDKSSDNSRDLTETNTIFFSLLPESLKKSFHEYEENQIESLNRLKQTYVNEYFASNENAQSPFLNSTQNRQGVSWNQFLSNSRSEYSTHVNSTTNLVSCSSQSNGTTLTKSFGETGLDETNQHKNGSNPGRSQTRSNQTSSRTRSNQDSSQTRSSRAWSQTRSSRAWSQTRSSRAWSQTRSSRAWSQTRSTRSTNTVTKKVRKDVMTLFSYRKQQVSFQEKRKLGLLKNKEKPVSENL